MGKVRNKEKSGGDAAKSHSKEPPKKKQRNLDANKKDVKGVSENAKGGSKIRDAEYKQQQQQQQKISREDMKGLDGNRLASDYKREFRKPGELYKGNDGKLTNIGPVNIPKSVVDQLPNGGEPRELPHDQVHPMAPTPPPPATASETEKLEYELMNKFQPNWTYASGVKPRPAVDAFGNWNAGLKDSGDPDGDPSDLPYEGAQTYARIISFDPGGFDATPIAEGMQEVPGAENVRRAIMYTQYFPKDHTTKVGANLGHRHDWEGVVVFLGENDEPLKVSYSAHGGFPTSIEPGSEFWSGDSPNVVYDSKDLEGRSSPTHSVYPTTASGTKEPLVQWRRMSENVRNVLDNTWDTFQLGRNFEDNLVKAWTNFDKVSEGAKEGGNVVTKVLGFLGF